MIERYILLIILSLLSACQGSVNKKEAPKAEISENIVLLSDAQLQNSKIESSKLEQKAISAVLKLNGKIDVPPQNMVSLSAHLGGYLKSTKLLEGMHVSKGEVIAVMEDQQYIQLQQDYLTAKVRFYVLEKEYQRQKELNESKASSDKVYENAQADYQMQKVLLNALSEKLKLIGINPGNLYENSISRSINIYSPINGYVSAIKINIGKYASPSEVLFELINPEDIHLALTVFEKDLDKLFIGQKLMAYNNQQAEKKYPCEIILIGKDINRERAAIVHCHFLKYDKKLVPGMYMNAALELAGQKAWIIANEGLVRYQGKEYVFMQVDKNKFELLEVRSHNSTEAYSQISFVEDREWAECKFVQKGAYTLLMSMKNSED